MSAPWGSGPWGAGPWDAGPWPGPPGYGGPAAPPYAGYPAYPPPRPAVPRGAPPHDEPRRYPSLMRSRSWGWWRPLLGLLLFAVVYMVAAVVIVLLGVFGGVAFGLGLGDLTDLTDPLVLLITNLSLIVAIPIVWLCWLTTHQMGIGWSSSVLGRLRWRLFLPLTWRALATLGVWIAAQVLVGVLAGD